jgi:hypothetical protein
MEINLKYHLRLGKIEIQKILKDLVADVHNGESPEKGSRMTKHRPSPLNGFLTKNIGCWMG